MTKWLPDSAVEAAQEFTAESKCAPSLRKKNQIVVTKMGSSAQSNPKLMQS
jgi:hypothetical protein